MQEIAFNVLSTRRQRGPLLSLPFSLHFDSFPPWAAEKMRLRVDDYQIDAELTPHLTKLRARAKVKFTALEDLSIATFELHNGLRLTKVPDAQENRSTPSASPRTRRSA